MPSVIEYVDCTDPESTRDFYVIGAQCGNCGWYGRAKFSKGYNAAFGLQHCPRCDCGGFLSNPDNIVAQSAK